MPGETPSGSPAGLIVAGFEFRPPPGNRPKPYKPRGPEIDEESLKWLLSRAAEFLESGGSLGRPAWGYAALTRNLRRSRKVKLSWRAVRYLIQSEDPGLFERRKFARLAAERPKRRACPDPACACPCHPRKPSG
jgi:hypothetical protein